MVYGLRAQSLKYDWDQGSEEKVQGSEEWDQVSAHIISWPRYITYSCLRLAAVPVIRSLGCLMKTWYHILNLFLKLFRAL